jgi:hypothetical protein
MYIQIFWIQLWKLFWSTMTNSNILLQRSLQFQYTRLLKMMSLGDVTGFNWWHCKDGFLSRWLICNHTYSECILVVEQSTFPLYRIHRHSCLMVCHLWYFVRYIRRNTEHTPACPNLSHPRLDTRWSGYCNVGRSHRLLQMVIHMVLLR